MKTKSLQDLRRPAHSMRPETPTHRLIIPEVVRRGEELINQANCSWSALMGLQILGAEAMPPTDLGVEVAAIAVILPHHMLHGGDLCQTKSLQILNFFGVIG